VAGLRIEIGCAEIGFAAQQIHRRFIGGSTMVGPVMGACRY
jgi:hypothetical protein